MILSRANKSFTFTTDNEDICLSETDDRFNIRVTIGDRGVYLDSAQFGEMCGLDGYGGLEVRTRPAPEPVSADAAPVEG